MGNGHKTLLRATLIALSAAIIWSASAVADSPRDIAKRVSPSVVLLVMEDSNGQPLAMGSGFVVREGIVATNMHVIEGAARGYAKLTDEKAKHDIQGVVASDPARDLVLLAVNELKASPLTIGDSDQVAVGDEVYAVGNPRGLEGTFSAGIVSSIRKVGADVVLQVTAPISPGSSGGPVVNSNGEVIGVAVATFKGGQNLNFAIPSRYLSALIPSIKPVAGLPEASKTAKGRKQTSIMDDFGGHGVEGVEGTAFRWDVGWGDQYSFSITNKLRETVSNVDLIVIFYDTKGNLIDFKLHEYPVVVPGGLAKRVNGRAEPSARRLNTPEALSEKPTGRIDIRILNFDIVGSDDSSDDDEPDDVPTLRGPSTPDEPKENEATVEELERKLAEMVARFAPAGNGPDLIESRIEGEFEGWDGDTIFKLDNGQIWQQVTHAYTYHYAYRPKVMIIKTYGAYKVKVDGVSGTIFVKRLK